MPENTPSQPSQPSQPFQTLSARPPIHVLFALLPGSLALDWAGPAEALRMANQVLVAQGLLPRFEIGFMGPNTEVQSSVGLVLAGLQSLPHELAVPSWVVLVGQAGSHIDVQTPPARALLQWLGGLHLAVGTLELVTICAGTLLAAHAGLLNGRRVTTHHQHLDELATAEPLCEVVSNRVFVQSGPVHSSAGVTTGVDLTLHLIAEHCGPAIAARVAQTMVVAMRRGPHDAELSPFLNHRNHLHPALHRVQDAVSQQPARAWTVPRMADVACTSPRHLARLFAAHAGTAPLDYLRGIRLATAQAALQSGHNVTQAAGLAGFSDTQLRRAWQQMGLAGTPSGHSN